MQLEAPPVPEVPGTVPVELAGHSTAACKWKSIRSWVQTPEKHRKVGAFYEAVGDAAHLVINIGVIPLW